jgi:predicted TIM-barrel fold metal-dependent hydrolase
MEVFMDRRNFLKTGALAGVAVAAAPLTAPVPARAAAPEQPTWPNPRGDEEAVLEPDLAIVDPHHHCWDLRPGAPRFMFPEIVAEISGSKHKIQQTVFIECGSMYRAEGPRDMRFVGEVEFVNGVAAQSASGLYGPTRIASGIVGRVDFTTGDAVKPVLEALIQAGDGRLKGTRYNAFYTEIPVMGMEHAPLITPKGLLADAKFRQGAAALGAHGLSMDTGCYHPQLPDMIAFVSSIPNVSIVLNHVGGPLTIGRYAADPAATFAEWKKGMTELAKRPNVNVKLGGLGQNWDYPIGHIDPASNSTALAGKWKPWIETTIELFGVQRCMFESNFPVDKTAASYDTIWNAFKRITAGASADQKAALYSGTARKVYRLSA